MEYDVIPFGVGEEAEEVAAAGDGVVITNARTGNKAAAVPSGSIDQYLKRAPEGSEREEIRRKAQPFKDYLADEYGYDPHSPLWEADPYDDSADVERATSFYKRLTPFTDDDRIEVVYARIDQRDEDLYVGLAEARPVRGARRSMTTHIASVDGDWSTEEVRVAAALHPLYTVHKINDGHIDVIIGDGGPATDGDAVYIKDKLRVRGVRYDEVVPEETTDDVDTRVEVHL